MEGTYEREDTSDGHLNEYSFRKGATAQLEDRDEGSEWFRLIAWKRMLLLGACGQDMVHVLE